MSVKKIKKKVFFILYVNVINLNYNEHILDLYISAVNQTDMSKIIILGVSKGYMVFGPFCVL